MRRLPRRKRRVRRRLRRPENESSPPWCNHRLPQSRPSQKPPESYKKKLVADDSLEALDGMTVPIVTASASASTIVTNKVTAVAKTGKKQTKTAGAVKEVG